jgi:hypothetical protein
MRKGGKGGLNAGCIGKGQGSDSDELGMMPLRAKGAKGMSDALGMTVPSRCGGSGS